ncbi:TPA: HNH endonuclease [Burkholderia vietnamiensis]|nr:HNH endonuclease [Burkholderia vietnamiensis]HDR9142108.1 HNH endonuclease [Burkholderia vietnamiensis]
MKTIKPLKPHETFLRECLDYDPETGILCWKKQRPAHHFKTVRGCKIWHAKFAGKPAGTKQGRDDRLQLHFSTIKLDPYVTRVIWLLATGNDSLDMVIDHINGNPDDNRLINLRLATPEQNVHNSKTYANNKTGYKGVERTPWGFRVTMRTKRVYFNKSYPTLDEAVAVRQKLERLHWGQYSREASSIIGTALA